MSEASPTIAVSNHKGGVGKTTVTAHVAAALAAAGYDVLAVDTDPQGTLSMHLTPTVATLQHHMQRGALDIDGANSRMMITRPEGPDVELDLEQRLPNAYEAFYGNRREDSLAIRLVAGSRKEYEEIAEEAGFVPGNIVENTVVPTTDGVDLIPANARLQGIEKVLADDSLAVLRLKNLLDDIEGVAEHGTFGDADEGDEGGDVSDAGEGATEGGAIADGKGGADAEADAEANADGDEGESGKADGQDGSAEIPPPTGRGVDGQYDFILIDTPATIGLLKDSAAIAAGNFLIPMQAESTSVSATQQHLADIEEINDSFDLNPEIVGIVPNEVRNDGEAKKVLSIIRKQIPDRYRRTHDFPDGFDAGDLPDAFWRGTIEDEDGTRLDGVPPALDDFWPSMGCRPFITRRRDYTEDVVPFEIATRVAIRRAYTYNRTLYSHSEECDQRGHFDRLAARAVRQAAEVN